MTNTAYNNLLKILATLAEHDEAGAHFTITTPPEILAALEAEGLITISRPVHEATGIAYAEEYWHLHVTDLGWEEVDAAGF